MRVLVADDDPDFCSFVLEALEDSDFEAHNITGEPARIATSNAILILGGGWSELRLAGYSASDQLVLAAIEGTDSAAVEHALMLGAVDVLTKPMTPAMLKARLMVARHRLITTPTAQHSPRHSLERALEAGETGALVIRGAGEHSGAIHVHDGHITWVEGHGRSTSLAGLLERAGVEIDADTSREVLNEARQTGKHFTEVLSAWRFADAEVIRACVRSYLAEEAAALLSASQLTAMFAPYDGWRAGTLRFTPEEILPAGIAASGVAPTTSLLGMRQQQTIPGVPMSAIHGISLLPGCVGVTLMERSGARLGSIGEPLDNYSAWSMVHAMRTSRQGFTMEEDSVVHLARTLEPNYVVIATFSLREVTLGLARTSMIDCCVRAAEGTLLPQQASGFQ